MESRAGTPDAPAADDLELLVTVPPEGDGALERQIRHFQQSLDNQPNRAAAVERLGWLFIAKARKDSSPAYELLAEHCAAYLARLPDHRDNALLLEGHLAHRRHEFAKAESIAGQLVASRGRPFDYGLLGDARLDRGDVAGAAEAYQEMMNLKPSLPSYLRAARIRWHLGDLESAITLAEMAVSAGSPRSPEPLAWALVDLSRFYFQHGDMSSASDAVEHALRYLPTYRPALSLKARMLMAEGDYATALPLLEPSDSAPAEPSHLWDRWECLRALGKSGVADEVRDRLIARGTKGDPRTTSLFLATAGYRTDLAEELARREIERRADVFTLDALAWALFRNGKATEALEPLRRALGSRVVDARLALHAGLILKFAGTGEENRERAARLLRQARDGRRMLLPSERALLEDESGMLSANPEIEPEPQRKATK